MDGGSAGKERRRLGNIDSLVPPAILPKKIQAPSFAYWLTAIGQLDLEEKATMFEGGDNRWRSFASWPPGNANPTPLYMGDEESLWPSRLRRHGSRI